MLTSRLATQLDDQKWKKKLAIKRSDIFLDVITDIGIAPYIVSLINFQNQKSSYSGDEELRNRILHVILDEKPNVKWDDVAGLSEAKNVLIDAAILPMRFPHLYTGARAPWRGILLYGPPGTGKSHIAKAIATESNSKFFSVSISDLVSPWHGESEMLVQLLFEIAREQKPSIIFIDEIDSFLSQRSQSNSGVERRMLAEFLKQGDGVGTSMDQVLLLAATNLPWELDIGVRRRFEKKIYVPLPDLDARKAMIELRLNKTPNTLQPNDIAQIATMIEGYSGADIKILVRQAASLSLQEMKQAEYFYEHQGMMYPCDQAHPGAQKISLMDIDKSKVPVPTITAQNFIDSIQITHATVSPSNLAKYEQWTAEFGQEA